VFQALALDVGAGEPIQFLDALDVFPRIVEGQNQPLLVGVEDVKALEIGEHRPADFFPPGVFERRLFLRRAVAAPFRRFGNQTEALDLDKQLRFAGNKQSNVRIACLTNVALTVVFKSAEYVPAQGCEELVNKVGADIGLGVNLVLVTIVTIQKLGQFLTKFRHGGI
jgi:hypothetical protein